MPTQTGTTSVFGQYPNGYMWTGNGSREVVKFISFSPPFSGTPRVSAALPMIDGSHQANLRVAVTVSDVTDHGFNVRVSTWADTKLAAASVSWVAAR